MRETVPEPLQLDGLLIADHDRLVATPEDLLRPAVQTPRLLRQLRAEVPHEACELLSVVNPQQQVQVIGGADDETDPDAIAAFGPGEGPEEDLVQLGSGGCPVLPDGRAGTGRIVLGSC